MLGDKQLRSIREADGAVNLWEGSIRSGKTVASLIRYCLAVADPPQGGEIVVIGRTRDSAWRNVIGPLQSPAVVGSDVAEQVVGNYGAPTVSMFGRRVYVMGASDVKAELTLRGLTVALAYVDEITTIPELFFVQLLGRMSVDGAQLFGTTNPDGPRHWLKTGYLDRLDQLPHWRHWHFTMADNPGLTEEYKTQKAAEFTGLWHLRFILGLWVQAEGAIYDMWDPARHVVAHDKLPRISHQFAAGIDYGTTNATRGYVLGITDEPTPRLAVVDEWAPRRGTDAHLSQDYRGWLAAGQHHPDWHFVDPAAASFKLQLFSDGLGNVANATNDVLAGIRCVSSLLSVDRLIVSDRCKHLVDQIPGYMWDPKATERGLDAPLKINDHEADALRYATYSSRGSWRHLVPVSAASDDAPGATDID